MEHTMDDPMTEEQPASQGTASHRYPLEPIRPHSVARLLGITLDDEDARESHGEETMGELLEAHLDRVWQADEGHRRAGPGLIRQMLCRNGSPAPQTLGELLRNRQTRLGTIKQIRDRAKAQAAREDSAAEHAVMTTIYFAAIANGLVYRHVKITTHSYASLESSFEKLIRKAWMPADLTELFRRAAKLCRQQ